MQSKFKDATFRMKFGLPPSELLMRKFDLVRREGKRVGRLFVSKNFLAFYTLDRMSRKQKQVITLRQVVDLSIVDDRLVVTAQGRRGAFAFRLKQAQLADAYSFIRKLRDDCIPEVVKKEEPQSDVPDFAFELAQQQNVLANHPSILDAGDSLVGTTMGTPSTFDKMVLNDNDRALLLQPQFLLSFDKDQLICSDEDPSSLNKLYLVQEGTVALLQRSSKDESLKTVSSAGDGSLLGYFAFVGEPVGLFHALQVSSMSAKVYCFEPYYIHLLFFRFPLFANRLLFSAAGSLLTRLANADTLEDQLERGDTNITDLPIFYDLPWHQLGACPGAELGTPLSEVVGPSNDEDVEASYEYNSSDYLCAKTTTTYPFDPRLPPKADGKRQRLGDPICDQFYLQIYHRCVIAAVADGCSWGDQPRDAAESACRTFVTYMQRYLATVSDTHGLAKLILRAFSHAHHSISRGKERLKSWEIGTTTLFGGVLLPVSRIAKIPIEKRIPPLSPSMAFVYANVGDCKGFRFSSTSQEVIDITPDTRQNNDASDCGGRLGPFLQGRHPDLRNFRLRYLPCFPGDIILIMSDGVYDNLDPEHLGLHPKRFSIDADDWKTISFERAEKVRFAYRLSSIREIILEHAAPDTYSIKPEQIVRALLAFVHKTNRPAVEWMEANPMKKLPTDYSRFPGKMDHSTVVCWVVKDSYATCAVSRPPPYKASLKLSTGSPTSSE